MIASFRYALLLWIGLSPLAAADVLVLIHGYLGDSDTWYESGVADVLERAGWHDGGKVGLTPSGKAAFSAKALGRAPRRFYAVELPSEAPLRVQSRLLALELQAIHRRHPKERLILVGHSAGGVVARLTMVEHPDIPVHALITIASPHLGTSRAEMALTGTMSPLGFIAPFMGAGKLTLSQGLFADLIRERPGTLLYWLNRQRHPKALYISIVRKKGGILSGDIIVPPYSQDMNNVPALKGKAETIVTEGGHGLRREDGEILIRLLESLKLGAIPLWGGMG